MKDSTKLKFAWSALVLFFFNIVLCAQEKKIDVDVNIPKSHLSKTPLSVFSPVALCPLWCCRKLFIEDDTVVVISDST